MIHDHGFVEISLLVIALAKRINLSHYPLLHGRIPLSYSPLLHGRINLSRCPLLHGHLKYVRRVLVDCHVDFLLLVRDVTTFMHRVRFEEHSCIRCHIDGRRFMKLTILARVERIVIKSRLIGVREARLVILNLSDIK